MGSDFRVEATRLIFLAHPSVRAGAYWNFASIYVVTLLDQTTDQLIYNVGCWMKGGLGRISYVWDDYFRRWKRGVEGGGVVFFFRFVSVHAERPGQPKLDSPAASVLRITSHLLWI